MTPNDNAPGEYIVEFIVMGKSVKVTAFDPVSLREATIIGSPRVSRKQLSALAVRKLEYVLRKQKKDTE